MVLNTHLYSIYLLITAGALLFFGLHLLLGNVLESLKKSSYSYSRKLMGASFILLALSIILFYTFQVNKLEKTYIIAYNLICYLGVSNLITASFISVIGCKLEKSSQRIKKNGVLWLLYTVVVWGSVLYGNNLTVKTVLITAAILFLINILLNVSRFFKKYYRAIEQGEYYYAEGIEIHISWMLKSLYSMAGIGVLSSIFAFSSLLPQWSRYIFLTAFLGVCTYIFFSFRHFMVVFGKLIDSNNSEEIAPETELNTQKLTPQTHALIKRNMTKWIAEKEFCRNKLTVQSVALELGTNRRYLSIYINNNYQCNFREWISNLRVIEVKRILSEERNVSISLAAERAGFLSLTSFTNIFTSIEGISPSKWLENSRATHP